MLKVLSAVVLVLTFLVFPGCASSPQSAPQIPLAPVYQAGSPVVIVWGEGLVPSVETAPSKSSKPTTVSISRVGHDARGDVGAEGKQEATPTQETPVDVTVPVDAGGSAVKEAVKAVTGASGTTEPASSPQPSAK